jgi:rubrerythrin
MLNPVSTQAAYSNRRTIFPIPTLKENTMKSVVQTLVSPTSIASRRAFMGRTGTLSAVASGYAGRQRRAGSGHGRRHGQRRQYLNVALGLEHEAINAYQLGAGRWPAAKPVLDVAVRFQADHKAHRDALIATIQKMGGTPVMEKKLDDYAKALKADTLRNQGDVLDLAARLELGAINAYLGVIPAFGSKDLAKVAGRLAADETLHFTVLTNALGRPLPAGALSFGA